MAATTYNALVGEKVYIDPSEGPWTIKFPVGPINNDSVMVTATAINANPVTFDGNGKNLEFLLGNLNTPAFSIPLNGNSIEFIFNEGRDTWQQSLSHLDQFVKFPDSVYFKAESVVLSTTPEIIPISYLFGDTRRFSVELDGSLTVLETLPIVILEADVSFLKTTALDPEWDQINLEFVLTSTFGVKTELPGTVVVVTPEDVSIETTLHAKGIFTSLEPGDNIALISYISDESLTDVTSEEALIIIPESPLYTAESFGAFTTGFSLGFLA